MIGMSHIHGTKLVKVLWLRLHTLDDRNWSSSSYSALVCGMNTGASWRESMLLWDNWRHWVSNETISRPSSDPTGGGSRLNYQPPIGHKFASSLRIYQRIRNYVFDRSSRLPPNQLFRLIAGARDAWKAMALLIGSYALSTSHDILWLPSAYDKGPKTHIWRHTKVILLQISYSECRSRPFFGVSNFSVLDPWHCLLWHFDALTLPR